MMDIEDNGVWKETRSTEEIAAERERERTERRELESGLRRCSVCGGAAKIVEFGLEGNGVWVGCDRTAGCSQYIEIHTEGWSAAESAAEWNKYNSGVYLLLRREKRWYISNFGAEEWKEKRENREKMRKMRQEEERRREIFGIEGEKKVGFWRRVLARRQKVGGKICAERTNN